jgi:hypothetical protein
MRRPPRLRLYNQTDRENDIEFRLADRNSAVTDEPRDPRPAVGNFSDFSVSGPFRRRTPTANTGDPTVAQRGAFSQGAEPAAGTRHPGFGTFAAALGKRTQRRRRGGPAETSRPRPSRTLDSTAPAISKRWIPSHTAESPTSSRHPSRCRARADQGHSTHAAPRGDNSTWAARSRSRGSAIGSDRDGRERAEKTTPVRPRGPPARAELG